MCTIRSVILVGFALLAACGPESDTTDVEPFGPEELAAQQTIQKGLSTSLAPAKAFEAFGKAEDDRSFHADVAFYETVLSYGPIADARAILLLTNAYIAANQQEYGISFLERLLKRYRNKMTDDVRAVHLSAYALLRATYAERVSILGRIMWVLDTFDLLEEAANLSENDPIVHWAAALIYAQVPGFFGKRDEAKAELLWLVEHPELEPTSGFYRDAYRYLAKLYAEDGEPKLANHYRTKSGYEDYEPETLFMGWFATTKEKGLRFAPTPWIEEIVPERVFAVRGFGFSDLHFIVSHDGRELVSIDAGTQPYSMEGGYDFLRDRYPQLPPLTTVFVTHAHWDHVSGYTYVKSLDADIAFYGRGNYRGTVERALRKPTYSGFRGEGFVNDWVSAYKPDVIVDGLREVALGGTTFELVPVTGGETEDAMLIHVPELSVLFMGDALMPFYGEPWVEEGFLDEAVNTMDEALKRKPKRILHGHVGITVLYEDVEQLGAYRDAYVWLVAETRKHLAKGYSAKNIIRLNLIPPGLQNDSDIFFSYLAPRDHIISRAADKMVGIWLEDVTGREPGGLDVITSVEYGRMFDRYLGLSAGEVEEGLQRMLDGGDNELALQMAVAAETRYPNSIEIRRLKERAGDRLRSSAQYFDPFKFVTYTELIGKEHREIPAEPIE